MNYRIAWAFGCGLLCGMACGQDDSCVAGRERCPCEAGACLTGLVCLSGYCVNPDWMPPDGESGDDANDDGTDFDNVAACEDLVEEFECGDLDLSTLIDCDMYGTVMCDIADYFDCVRNEVECEAGAIDPMQLADCANLAQCD